MEKSLKDAVRGQLEGTTRAKERNACKGLDDEGLVELGDEVVKEAYDEDGRSGLVGARP
ncbi:hypothetical protein [Streptomyces sp. NPDC046870]|uniref:hypothetical protein n=1 Tax=Streptomyces sp. NPDC046870 TaxID=3155135 RepID=UPI0034548AC0